jgi:hypothetical protein
LNFSGYLRNSTTSWSSGLRLVDAGDVANVTTVLLPRNIRARLLPKLIAWLFVPWACRIMKKMNPPMMRSGRTNVASRPIHDVSGAGSPCRCPAESDPSRLAAACMSWKTWVRTFGT